MTLDDGFDVNGATVFDGKSHGATASVIDEYGLNQTLEVTYTGTDYYGNIYNATKNAPINAGSYSVMASFDGDDDHNSSYDIKSFIISIAISTTPVITLDEYIKTPTNNDITVTATTNEGTLNVTSHTFTENGSFDFVATDAAGNVTTQTVTITNIDKDAPVITLNGNALVLAEVHGSYSDEGALLSDNYDESRTVMGTGTINYNILGDYKLTYTAVDEAGNAAIPITRTIRVVDTTAPIISLNGQSPISVKLGTIYVDGGATANDNYDGVITGRIVTDNQVSTAKIGTYSVLYNVSDANGNAAVQVRRIVNVIYNFSGFRQPIDIDVNVINTVKAGSAIPVKFSLKGNHGLNIFSAGYPTSITATFSPTGLIFDAVEEVITNTTGGSTLSYDAGADQYVYVWKTDKLWTGYRILNIKFADGTTYTANFKFTK